MVIGLILLAFTALGVALIVVNALGETRPQPILLGTGFSAVCLYFGTKSWHRAFLNPPRLTISQEGINDQASLWRIGQVRWDEVESVEIAVSGWRTVLVVKPVSFSTWLSRMGPVKGLLCFLHVRLTVESALEIPPAILPVGVTLEDVIGAMLKFNPGLNMEHED